MRTPTNWPGTAIEGVLSTATTALTLWHLYSSWHPLAEVCMQRQFARSSHIIANVGAHSWSGRSVTGHMTLAPGRSPYPAEGGRTISLKKRLSIE